MNKIGLIVEGGGMKCAYSAGVLDAFLDHGLQFPYCIGVSAGSANMLSYVAGQRGRARRFYVDHIDRPGYFGVRSLLRRNGGLFGLRYIYGTLSNSDGEDPLDFAAIRANPAEAVVVATDAVTGMPAYFPKARLRQDDYREVMASSAIPMVCRPVRIGRRLFFDGGISDAIPIAHALDNGCDKVVVLLSKPRSYMRPPQKHRALYHRVLHRYPGAVNAIDRRHLMYNDQLHQLYTMERERRAFVFTPSRKLKMDTYAMNKEANQQLYELGVADAERRMEELQAFLADGNIAGGAANAAAFGSPNGDDSETANGAAAGRPDRAAVSTAASGEENTDDRG
ncbi:MAG: patatin-like phospholipase family protein [Anaerovoracaceae bacterium]|jgi:predicted patatin/cPLA2 family phospholipase